MGVVLVIPLHYSESGVSMEEGLLFGENKNILFIKAVGHITARQCTALRNRVISILDSREEGRDIFVDLSSCEYMDSTFIGLLVVFNKRLARHGNRFSLIKPRKICVTLLENLGVYNLFDMAAEPYPLFPENMEVVSETEEISSELLLKAHEELMELSPENRKRFEALHGILKAKILTNRNT